MEVLTLYTFLHIIQKLVVDMSRNWYSKITLLSWQRNKYFSFNKSLYLCNAIEFVKVTFIGNQKYKFSPWSIIDENHSVFTECMLLGKHLNNLSQFNTRNLFIWAADWELTCDLDCKLSLKRESMTLIGLALRKPVIYAPICAFMAQKMIF